jgi:hypothetical protein
MPQVEDSGEQTARPGPSLRLLAVIALVAGVACLAMVARLTGLAPRDTLSPSCACATAPDPNWTPSPSPPVSLQQAASSASRVAGIVMSPADGWYSIGGIPVSMPIAGRTFALVRGDDATVLEVVVRDQLPDSDSVVVTEAAARASAKAFEVAWASSEGEPTLDVLVNALTGQVFAYLHLGTGARPPAPPIFGYLAAVRLAMSSGQAAGETPYSVSQEPDWQVYPGSPDGHDFSCYVVFQDGVLAVDAASGEVWVMKWAQDLTAS